MIYFLYFILITVMAVIIGAAIGALMCEFIEWIEKLFE